MVRKILATFSPCLPFSPSPRRPVAVSPCLPISLSPLLPIALSPRRRVSPLAAAQLVNLLCESVNTILLDYEGWDKHLFVRGNR
jgi:hypothetical protein